MDSSSIIANVSSLSGSDLQAAEKALPQFDQLETVGTYSFVWSIDNFSKLNRRERLEGPVFKTDHYYTWRLVLYPESTTAEGSVGLFLENVDCKNKASSKDACAVIAIRIIDPQDPTRFFRKVFHHRFTHYETDWGYYDFIKRDILYDDEQPYVVDDKLVIELIIQLKKDPTGVLWHNFKVYDSKKTTGYNGLYNQGATCYMNSLFQSLFFTNMFRKSVYQIPTENDNPQESVALALQRLFFNLQFSDSTVSTTEITQSFGWNSSESFMQHDVQEFNRILLELIERKMLNTPAEGTIRDIFVGKTKSYIKCMNVNYESSRSEEFYDIQLNVKGCRDLKESFEDYVREEILEKENKYMADGHGLQDAKKGVIFETLPPVLQIQLKRFDYDMEEDAMVKINDRHEFPAEIDLQPYHISREEQSQSQQSPSFKYILHGVLVHTGSVSNGHYFAFVRPTKEDKWFEFNDERVTPAALDEVFEANYGGQSKHAKKFKTKRETNAYMLVYIRESSQDQVLAPVTIDDIPHHLLERFENEKKLMKAIVKERAEQHLYMTVFIVTDTGFLLNNSVGFIDLLPQSNYHPYQKTRWLRTMTVGDFLQQYTAADNRNINYTRVWIINYRRRFERGRLQPGFLIPTEEYHRISLQSLLTSDYPFLRLYIENCPIQEAPTDPEDTLLFVKYYDPVTQTLSGVGKLYVSYETPICAIQDNLNIMVGLERGVRLDIYKEHDNYELEEMVYSFSFQDYDFIDGDIICFQRRFTDWQAEGLLRAGKFPDALSYYMMLLKEVNVRFLSRDSVYRQTDYPSFTLALYSTMSIPQVILEVARHLKQDPHHIQLLYSSDMTDLRLKAIDCDWNLRDALELCPEYDSDNDEEDLRYLKQVQWTLYYDVLPMSLADARGKKIYRINVCNTFNQPQTKALLLSKSAQVSEMCQLISPLHKVRIFKVINPSTVETIGMRCTAGHWLKPDADNVYAEITPKEECNISQEDFYITVYHYEKTLTQTHSIPFKFLIIKDEPFNQTKRRLQERTGLGDEQWSQVNVNLLHSGQILSKPEQGIYKKKISYTVHGPLNM
ncbi:unnamed protein product [Mucor circinelloides]